MAYGTLKCDNITFTNGDADQTITVSGIVQSISGDITATGTIQGATIVGTSTVSGATVTGDSGQYGNLNSVSGVFTTQISGATVTGDTGSFTNVTVGVATITSGVFALGGETLPSISFSSDPDTGIYSPDANQVAISTNGTGRLFVDDGNIYFGSTSPVAPSMYFQPGSGGGQFVKNTDSTSSRTAFAFKVNDTNVGSITTSFFSTAYNTSSDYRLKEHVVAVTDGITRLQQLKPSRFNFIADPDTTVDGFLAHEVQDIVPEAITGEKDAVDEDGNPIYQGIDQSKLVPLLTAALQEAIGRIEALEAEVAALKA